jgi:hypothetical protein
MFTPRNRGGNNYPSRLAEEKEKSAEKLINSIYCTYGHHRCGTGIFFDYPEYKKDGKPHFERPEVRFQ